MKYYCRRSELWWSRRLTLCLGFLQLAQTKQQAAKEHDGISFLSDNEIGEWNNHFIIVVIHFFYPSRNAVHK